MVGIVTRATLALGLACMVGACSREDEVDDGAAAADSAALSSPVATELAVWDVRFDDPSSDAGGFQMIEEGGGWAVKTGANGAAITWRDQDMVHEGSLVVSAAMEEHAAPADHREGYGLFVGGRNLQQPDQQYTYFLVRGDGSYLIKRRDGEATPTLKDWTPSPAIAKVVNAGDVTRNTLEIRVDGDVTRFFVNGTEVESLPNDQVQPHGIAGLRINHALDMRVTRFEVQAGAAGAAPTPGGAAAPVGGDTAVAPR